MNTYTIRYEAGAVAKTATARGADVYEAIQSLGFRDAQTFMWMRVITWSKVD